GVYFKMVEEAIPAIVNDTDVKIRIDAIGICTSDIHVLHGTMTMPDGNTVGHEYTGTIVEVGSAVENVVVGDRVVCENAKGACLQCKLCVSGHYELCPKKTSPGWFSQGVYTEYTIQPERCVHKIPQGLPMDVAAVAEPFAICVYGCLERGRIRKDDFTVIYGMGPIGLFTLITLVDFGVKNIVCVVSTRKNNTRYELAKELGATVVLLTEDNIHEKVKELNEGWGADCVIDCSGDPKAINQGIGLLIKGGKFIALGLSHDDEIPIAFNKAVLGVIEMIFSATSSHAAWVTVLGILERNPEKVKKVITHRYALDDWELAYEKIANREAVKAVLLNKWDDNATLTQT
ncbi:MAG TPA: alcohol dehydrogenase catalytic domain-containing protein, partial [Chitinophagaceae bacterium]|nr:alcohol dehydrogenase catalytic domain-containing protein [Chitinophagaceae bacterium]